MAAQALHAAIEFCIRHREISEHWNKISNYICILQINDEQQLINLTSAAKLLHIVYTEFREPDLENSLTAICLCPGKVSKKLVQKLKLAFI